MSDTPRTDAAIAGKSGEAVYWVPTTLAHQLERENAALQEALENARHWLGCALEYLEDEAEYTETVHGNEPNLAARAVEYIRLALPPLANPPTSDRGGSETFEEVVADRIVTRALALEEAAKVCDDLFADPNWHPLYRNGSMSCARAIRNVIPNPPPTNCGEIERLDGLLRSVKASLCTIHDRHYDEMDCDEDAAGDRTPNRDMHTVVDCNAAISEIERGLGPVRSKPPHARFSAEEKP